MFSLYPEALAKKTFFLVFCFSILLLIRVSPIFNIVTGCSAITDVSCLGVIRVIVSLKLDFLNLDFVGFGKATKSQIYEKGQKFQNPRWRILS